ncbi:MAG TPA: hypothetical protein VIV11_09105 [Kofleriaceae bacterium]
MKTPFEMMRFMTAVDLLMRAIDRTRRRLAAAGVVCEVQFTVAVRPEVAAMRAGVAQSGLRTGVSSTAPTEPALAVCHGPIGGRR